MFRIGVESNAIILKCTQTLQHVLVFLALTTMVLPASNARVFVKDALDLKAALKKTLIGIPQLVNLTYLIL